MGSGRVEHTLHELLNKLLEEYDFAVQVLGELRNACKNTRGKHLTNYSVVF